MDISEITHAILSLGSCTLCGFMAVRNHTVWDLENVLTMSTAIIFQRTSLHILGHDNYRQQEHSWIAHQPIGSIQYSRFIMAWCCLHSSSSCEWYQDFLKVWPYYSCHSECIFKLTLSVWGFSILQRTRLCLFTCPHMWKDALLLNVIKVCMLGSRFFMSKNILQTKTQVVLSAKDTICTICT